MLNHIVTGKKKKKKNRSYFVELRVCGNVYLFVLKRFVETNFIFPKTVITEDPVKLITFSLAKRCQHPNSTRNFFLKVKLS